MPNISGLRGRNDQSPHFTHIRPMMTDFYGSGITAQGLDFGAVRFDAVMSGGLNNWKSRNPTILHLPYTLLWTVYQPIQLSGNNTDWNDLLAWYNDPTKNTNGYNVEDALLHYQAGEVFSDWQGSTSAQRQAWYDSNPSDVNKRDSSLLKQTTAVGDGSSAERKQVRIWDSWRFIYDPTDPGIRQYWNSRFDAWWVAGEDGIFFDEFGSGGMGAAFTSLEGDTTWYQTGMVDWLTTMKTTYPSKLFLINVAEYITAQFDQDCMRAAGAAHMERINNLYSGNIRNSWSIIDQMLADGVWVEMVNLTGWTEKTIYSSSGNYSSPMLRMRMFELCSYYMCVLTDPSKLYLDQSNSSWTLPVDQIWLYAQEVNIGHPKAARALYVNNPDPLGQNAPVYKRDFDNGFVLIRPKADYNDNANYDDPSAVTVTLPTDDTYYFVKDDGTCEDTPRTTVQLRLGEGAIFLSQTAINANPPIPVATVTVSPTSTSMQVGVQQRFTATPRDANGNPITGVSVAWSTDNSAVATVSPQGLVTGAGVGTTTLTATADGKTGTATITVTPLGTGPGVSPLSFKSDDFASYPDTNSFISSTTKYSAKNGTDKFLIDESVQYNGHHSLQFNFPTTGGAPKYFVSLGSTSYKNLWFRKKIRFSQNFSMNAQMNLCSVYSANGASIIGIDSQGWFVQWLRNGGTDGNIYTRLGSLGNAKTDNAFYNIIANVDATNPAQQIIKLWVAKDDGSVPVLLGTVTGTPLNGKTTEGAVELRMVDGWYGTPATAQSLWLGQWEVADGTQYSDPYGINNYASAVSITPTSTSVVVGSDVQLTATATDASGNPISGKTFTWTTSDPAIATIDSNGLVTGVAAGTATITAAADARSATSTVTVTATAPGGGVSPIGIHTESFKSDDYTTYADTAAFLASSKYSSWSSTTNFSLDPTQQYNGHQSLKFTFPSTGGAPRFETYFGSSKTSVWVRMKVKFSTGFTTKSANPNMFAVIGGSSGNFIDLINNSMKLEWTYGSNGNGLSSGIDVSAMMSSGAWYEFVWHVENLSSTQQRLRLWMAPDGQQPTLVGTLAATGTAVQGMSYFRSVHFWGVTPTTEQYMWMGQWEVADGTAYSDPYSVIAPPSQPTVSSVTVSPNAPTLTPGGTQQLTATAKDATGTVMTGKTFTWTSSNAAIATVSSTGLVQAIAPGTATITATTDGISGTSLVTVNPPPTDHVVVSPASTSLLIGATATLVATAYDAANNVLSGKTPSWTSSAPSVATVDQNGIVRAGAAGTTTITGAIDGKSGTSTMTVTAPAPPPDTAGAPPSLNGFWVALANSAGLRVSGTEFQLRPAPTAVEYDAAPLGAVLETADGRAIHQQPSRDPRRRAWIWKGYPGFLTQYERLFEKLNTYRSRYRQAVGQSPYVYVFENASQLLRRKVQTTVTVAGSGNTSTVLQIADAPDVWAVVSLKDATVEVLPSSEGGTGTGQYQNRSIVSNTATTLTVADAFTVIPDGAKVIVTWWAADWFKARVLEVSRKLREDGGNVRYDESKFVFVIEDEAWNNLG